MIIDFMIFLTNGFLILVNRSDEDIKSRCIYVVAINVFNYVFLALSIVYMWLISNGTVSYRKLLYGVFAISIALLIFILIRKRYDAVYEAVVEKYTEKYNIGKFMICLLFLLIFLSPIFGIGIGMQVLRSVLYGK